MSAFAQTTDSGRPSRDVRFVPQADIEAIKVSPRPRRKRAAIPRHWVAGQFDCGKRPEEGAKRHGGKNEEAAN